MCKFFGKKFKSNELREVIIGRPEPKAQKNKLSTTKYGVIDFLPQFLFAKFTEPSNLFFLILTVIMLFPNISPFDWHSTGGPLILILVVNAATEIYEDLGRRFSDRRVNNTQVEAFDEMTNTWIFIKWKQLREGQLVRIGKGEKVPADLLLLSSSEPGGIIYMETSNLDGEANLKIRQSVTHTMAIESKERVSVLINSNATVQYDAPSRGLENFKGVITISKSILPLTSKLSDRSWTINDEPNVMFPLSGSNLVVRGATVHNTEWLLGVVLYAGKNTKIAMNSVKKSTKISIMHRITNWMVLTQIGWLFLIAGSITFWARTGDTRWLQSTYGIFTTGYDSSVFELFLGQLILFANLVPISLYVSIEGCLMFQAYYLKQDLYLYDEERDQRIEVHSFGAIPNLGAIKYVMCDKTGTLTTNMMYFKFCSIGGEKYGKRSARSNEFNSVKMLRELRTNVKGNAIAIELFLLACALCHTVVIERPRRNDLSRKDGETSFSQDISRRSITIMPSTLTKQEPIIHACSPDEACLVRFANSLHYCFTARTPDSITLDINGQSVMYQLLALIEFSSIRKRMTVVVRNPEGKIQLFIKGADTKIMAMLSPSSNPRIRSMTQAHLKEFANMGHRTLCFGYRDICEEEFKGWYERWLKANCDLENRQNEVERVAELIEKDIILLGASAIEDKLQDRVPQTIARMLQADLRVWVLTGDKLETALNIGYSCSLVSLKMPTLILATSTEDETAELLDRYVNTLGTKRLDQRDAQMALIVDAHCLDWVLQSPIMRMDFLQLALCCSAVICCRCTPIQKASVIRLVKHNVDGGVLAIGDGANDVAMIQEADVGVGIAGLEGGQASMAADFAITRFRHLDRLLFVHGSCCYHRITLVVLFTLYKNLFEAAMNILYAFYNCQSGSAMVEEQTMVRYNLLYTSIIVAIIGIHDAPAPLHVMSKYPRLYTYFQENLTIRSHLTWSVNAALHAFFVFHFMLYWWKFGECIFKHGKDGWKQMLGSYVYLCLVVIVNLKALVESRSIHILTVFGVVSSMLITIAMLASDSFLFPFHFPIFAPNTDAYLGLIYSLPSASTALFLPLVCIVCLLPDVAVKTMNRTLDPSLLQRVVQSMKVKDDVLDLILRQPIIKIADVVGLKAHLEGGKYGFMFAQDDGRVITQADLLRMYGAADCNPENQAAVSPIPGRTMVSETNSLGSLTLHPPIPPVDMPKTKSNSFPSSENHSTKPSNDRTLSTATTATNEVIDETEEKKERNKDDMEALLIDLGEAVPSDMK